MTQDRPGPIQRQKLAQAVAPPRLVREGIGTPSPNFDGSAGWIALLALAGLVC